MGLLLFRAFLVINAFNIATENPVTPKPYRFPVYPVNECPRSENEFKTAAQRRNCPRGLRYLCAPNKYLSSLIEFCTDRQRGLYQKGNCVILEGTGDLDHYSCVEKFNSSCPLEYYYDEEIYKYPACLEIDQELRCFVADNGCNKREFHTTETHLNISKMETIRNETFRGASHGWLAIGYIIAIAVVLAVIILIWIIFPKREKEQREKCKDNNENESLLKDSEPPIEENDDTQLDQASVNVSKQNQMQITRTAMLSETANRETRSKSIQTDEKQNKESEQNAAPIDEKQQDNPEIDDDKLRQFLSKGEITVCHVRCIIVGCGKAGKTTLLKRLQNVSFDELMQIERTEMVDFHVNSFEVLLEEDTIQSVEKEDTLPTILFSKEKLEMPLKENPGKMAEETDQPGIRKKNVSEKSSMKNTTLGQIENIPMDILKNPANNDDAENEEKSIFEPHSQDKTLVQNQFSPKTNEKHGEDIDANVDKIDFEKYAILKIKDAVNELLNETDLRPRITFLDFAGQSMYYAFHQIFLRPKSFSILVVDMTKSLSDKVDVEDNNEKECSQFDSWRYRDYYKFWLKSIDSFSDTETPVIIVGTHADKLSIKDCRKFVDDLFEFFYNWHHFDLRRHLNADRIYTIGFPETGSELEDLKDLKKCIANIVKAPCYLEENIRPVWALFEHILIKMKETEKVIPRKILSDYSDQISAQEFRMDDSEISKMLVFLHRVGILLYFDKDGLKENIILDIQWLLDALKCIIKYRVRTEVNDMKRKHFYRTGELDDAELDRIWLIEGKDYLKHKLTIIAYMQQLGLLTPLKALRSVDSTVYYFPSMNSKKFDKTGENNSKSSILSFKFDEKRQLPINVFHCIVLKCSKLNNWSILTEGAKDNICLYQNAACFSFKRHVVVLCHCNFEIRVQVWASPNIYDANLLKLIKNSVEDIIQDDERLSYEIGYKCRKDVLNVEEDISFISQNIFPVSNHLCETCDVDKKHAVDNNICWDDGVNEENQASLNRSAEVNKLTVSKAMDTNVLPTRYDNEHIGLPDTELESGTDTILNIEEHALPEIAGVANLMHSDMVDNTDAWTENINLENLSNLFDSFNIVIPEDTRNLFDTTKLDEFVSEIRMLARRIVLCKHIKDEDKILGTVYVYDVAVKHKENEIVVEEMDPREQLDFFHRKNDNLIKVIRIKGGSPDVSETKRKVYEKYKKFLTFQTIHLHHEMEHYAEVSKLIAHKKIKAYIQYIKSVRNSIPINHIGDIVTIAVNQALSKESITQLCLEAVIQESGNMNSDHYFCLSSSTVERLKKELIEKTLESVSEHLGSEICAAMQRHIVSNIKSKFKSDLDSYKKIFDISNLILLQSVLTAIAAIINTRAGIVVLVVSTLLLAVNVNSEAWRRNVATEIYEKVSKNKQEVVQEVTSSMLKICKITKDELDNIVGQLETFRRRKDLSDQVLLTT